LLHFPSPPLADTATPPEVARTYSLDLSVGSIRWTYPLTYGSPRSVSRTRCLHPLVEVAWTEVLLLSGSHSPPYPAGGAVGLLAPPLPFGPGASGAAG
jgi:hypothetical protein